jgi:uncharacterized membrane protein SirB2
MAEYYFALRHAHIGLAILSVGLFALRGALVLAGSPRRGNAAPLRYASYAIDSLLLTAALMLMSALHLQPFSTGWLGTKIALLAVYVVLGSVALTRARTPRARALAYAGALLTVALLVSVARAHHPLGAFAGWLASG